jgi:hypothetical protein
MPYAFGQVTGTFGSMILRGFALGSPMSGKRNVPRVTTNVGADGLGCDVVSSNNSGVIDLIFQASSPNVAQLNAAAKALTQDTLSLTDENGTEQVRMVCRVTGEADFSFGEELTTRKFTFTSIAIDISGGGGHTP